MSIQIIAGDCREVLAGMPDESVHCCVCSPPYWALRDYGVEGQVGLEPTLGEHIELMVSIFREVRRVLRSDGTVWLNYGDTYAGGGNGGGGSFGKDGIRAPLPGSNKNVPRRTGKRGCGDILKPKDLCMASARLAIALQADGWWIRSEIVWAKPNPMPESVTDRPATAHEKIYLLTKSARYFYDAEAVRQPAKPDTPDRYERGRSETHKWADGGPGNQTIAKGFDHMIEPKEARRSGNKRRKTGDEIGTGRPNGDHRGRGFPWEDVGQGANLRNVWTIATAAFSEAHFATFPPKLIEPCIKAGTSERGVCAECGAPWVREAKVGYVDPPAHTPGSARRDDQHAPESRWAGTERWSRVSQTVGWRASCNCDAPIVPAMVIDPFGGAGTTALVAD